jgi:hypothetical protein
MCSCYFFSKKLARRMGRELRERDDGSNVNNVQYKSNRNCHYESPRIMIYPNKSLLKILARALLTIAKLWKQPRCPTTDE